MIKRFKRELSKVLELIIGIAGVLSVGILLATSFPNQISLIVSVLQITILVSALIAIASIFIWVRNFIRVLPDLAAPYVDKLIAIFKLFIVSMLLGTEPILMLDAQDFLGVSFSQVLSARDSVVIVGSRERHGKYMRAASESDWNAAEKLCAAYRLIPPISDVDAKPEYFDERNVILIGGPLVNTITYFVNSELPIQTANLSVAVNLRILGENIDFDKVIWSTISNSRYSGNLYGIVLAAPSPYNRTKRMILAHGLTRNGTELAVQALIEHVDELDQNNKKDDRYPARIVKMEETKLAIVE